MEQINVNEINSQVEKTVIMKTKISKVYSLEELSETNTAMNNETVFLVLNSQDKRGVKLKSKSVILKKVYVNGEPIILTQAFIFKYRKQTLPEVKYSVEGPWGTRAAVFNDDEDGKNLAFREFERRVKCLNE